MRKTPPDDYDALDCKAFTREDPENYVRTQYQAGYFTGRAVDEYREPSLLTIIGDEIRFWLSKLKHRIPWHFLSTKFGG